MKPVSSDYLALFDSTSRKIYFYSQRDDFNLEKEFNLSDKIDTGLELARDTTKSLLFFNEFNINVCNFH